MLKYCSGELLKTEAFNKQTKIFQQKYEQIFFNIIRKMLK